MCIPHNILYTTLEWFSIGKGSLWVLINRFNLFSTTKAKDLFKFAAISLNCSDTPLIYGITKKEGTREGDEREAGVEGDVILL